MKLVAVAFFLTLASYVPVTTARLQLFRMKNYQGLESLTSSSTADHDAQVEEKEA